ncbi:tripartite tricarboxylate transporter permease [Rhodobium gokarnense]|uniref:Tricarboxylic transport membrane protein n=1 Tax=Rhodobium gokarnense TaxID=364296 RepID=A0ABT3H7E5_9HYPH|nr:tripartite tricarboxylate transporter permease [Rhodobium gokarnense]MCW2306305.1 putative tricarboxylic transport membrane protein [Rhodobium gokarnense]
MLGQILNILTSPSIMLISVLAMAFGILMGALPGLTAPMAMALLLGFVYTLPTDVSVVAMVMIFIGGVYGGSMSAILLNIPGAPASAATALDGHPLALQGRAGEAIGLCTVSSGFGSFMGAIFMALLTPWLVKFSLQFASWELLFLVLFGVIIAGSLAAEDPVKGWMSGFLGLLIAMVGFDDLHSVPRFTFGSSYLAGGVGLIAAIVGLFGISQVVISMGPRESNQHFATQNLKRVLPRFSDLKDKLRLSLQSSVIGTLIGILPGLGSDLGAWASYSAAKQTSKTPEKFGKGSIEGVVAAETGNNAVVPGSIIPVIALGLPGSAGAAIFMAALFLHGLKPGPTFLIDNLDLFHYLVAALLVGAVLLVIVGLITARAMINVLRVPREHIMAVVVALAVIGAYASKLQFDDLWMMFAFGAIGLAMRAFGFSLAPLTLGIVLGRPLDEYLRNALIISQGDLTEIFQRPIATVLLSLIVLFMLVRVPFLRRSISTGIGMARLSRDKS